jgi:hypothetical protein
LNPDDATDALLDPDGDGLTTGEEHLAGTDPLDPESFLRLDLQAEASSITLIVGAVSNRTYTVQSRNDPQAGGWLNLTDLVARTTNRIERVTVSPDAPRRYYRLVTPRQP